MLRLLKALALPVAAISLVSASSPPQLAAEAGCEAPRPVPVTVTTPNATFYTDVEPPTRFAHAPKGSYTVMFGVDAIDKQCGRPPCGMHFLGCRRGNLIVLPDPFSAPNFAQITRHELGHVNGWPDTHGD